MDVGTKIKIRREELGMTQEELAKKLGKASRSSVNKVENSKELTMKTIKQYADVLDLSVPYLCGWEVLDEKVETDIKLQEMDNRMKEYAIRLSALSKEKQEQIFSLIDILS